MGNIVKFADLDPHWERIKEETIIKYGNDDHEVTNKIAKELGVEKKVILLT
ncbi:MAG: hypothetical protein ARM1_0529 [Candidatus Micrarchaeota archaeon]|nr:MAG: hypothetical protein ARM1_0529 [Candidatus Micrarchaeota archaeon]